MAEVFQIGLALLAAKTGDKDAATTAQAEQSKPSTMMANKSLRRQNHEKAPFLAQNNLTPIDSKTK
jgi:hypothetical protein